MQYARPTPTDATEIPDSPQHHTPSSYRFMEPVLHTVVRATETLYYEVLIEFNYGPHACSYGAFSGTISKHDATSPTTPTVGSNTTVPKLGVSKPTARRALAFFGANRRDPPSAVIEAIRRGIETFEPNPQQLPKWSDRHVPRPTPSDAHPTNDPAFLVDHPNLTVTDDRTLGDYTLPNADTDGVVVHRPPRDHTALDRPGDEFDIQGAGVELQAVSRIVVDGTPYNKATSPPVSGYYRRFYPRATVCIDDGVAYISTDDGRQWTPP